MKRHIEDGMRKVVCGRQWDAFTEVAPTAEATCVNCLKRRTQWWNAAEEIDAARARLKELGWDEVRYRVRKQYRTRWERI